MTKIQITDENIKKPIEIIKKALNFKKDIIPNKSLTSTHSHKNEDCIIEGYIGALDALFAKLKEGYNEMNAIPFLFICRHIVELRLKFMTNVLHSIDNKIEKPRMIHSIKGLWDKIKKGIRVYVTISDYSFTVIDDFMKLVDKIDPKGTTFRYENPIPREKDFSEYSKENYYYFNFETLYDGVKELNSLLTYIISEIK